jgi:hypothetical protein
LRQTHIERSVKEKNWSNRECDELFARLEFAHQRVAPILLHKSVEASPGNEFEKIVENTILVPHGVDPFSCPEESPNPLNRVESMSCASSSQNQPDTRGKAQHIWSQHQRGPKLYS